MKLIDLSVELAHDMPRYPSPYLPPVSVVAAATHEIEKRSAQIITFGTHTSTHIDAPFHAIPDGNTVDQIPLHQLVGEALALRIPTNGIIECNAFEKVNLATCKKLILITGWAKEKWGSDEYFTRGPYLSHEAALYLSKLPELHLLGMDFPNVDSASETIMGKIAPNHKTLLGKNIILLENLQRVEELTNSFTIVAAPPKLTGGDGCPCRAFAIINNH